MQETITEPDNLRVISSYQSPDSSICFCTEEVRYWFDPVKNRKDGVHYLLSGWPQYIPAVNERYITTYRPSDSYNGVTYGSSVFIGESNGGNTGRYIYEDSLHLPNMHFASGWDRKPFASLSPCRNSHQESDAYSYACVPLISNGKGYVCLAYVKDTYTTTGFSYRTLPLPEESLQLLEPLPLSYLLTSWAGGKFFVTGLHSLFALDTLGTFTAVAGFPDYPNIDYVKEFGPDTLAALCLQNHSLYLSTDGGNTFSTRYEPGFLENASLFKVGKTMVATAGPNVYTFRWGQNIHLQKMDTEGMPQSTIQAVYKVGDRVYFMTEAGIYSKDYQAFLQATVSE